MNKKLSKCCGEPNLNGVCIKCAEPFETQKDYSHISHTHCWKNPHNPCGIPYAEHKQCCLCDLPHESQEEQDEIQEDTTSMEEKLELIAGLGKKSQSPTWEDRWEKFCLEQVASFDALSGLQQQGIWRTFKTNGKDFITQVEKEAYKKGLLEGNNNCSAEEYQIRDMARQEVIEKIRQILPKISGGNAFKDLYTQGQDNYKFKVLAILAALNNKE